MSSRKRPLSELRNTQTPSRYAPSTPHAIHALQQRSGAKTRSVRRPRAFSDTVRPDSARGILRRLAKITAPLTRKAISTPATATARGKGRGKENQTPRSAHNGGDEDAADEDTDTDTDNPKRPRLALELDDSLDDVEPPAVEDDEDSELPLAPTPSILPDEDDDNHTGEQGRRRIQRNDPTMTFKSIDFARDAASARTSATRFSRRWSKASDQLQGDEIEEDPTILTEMGRRAISEEPTGRLSRYSFGSIRMSDFGSELEIRRESTQREQPKTFRLQNEYSGVGFNYEPLDLGGETEHLENLGRPSPSPPPPPPEESTMNILPLEESFQLEMLDREAVSSHAQTASAEEVLEGETTPAEPQRMQHASSSVAHSSREGSPVGEVVPSSSRPRRKKVKLTRHGELVPSLPSSVIKRVAIEAHARLGNRKPKLGRDHMEALEQATEWFFEQVGEDLAAYSDHARRKKRIDRSDVLMLMRRQRVLQGDGELQKAVRELLPKEAAAELNDAIN
ncbi:hypothetical protein A1O3_00612 [Capronia epimyces CBS 606.96]|uniref:CENP-T/Histone H4 histone fold domain-containing protein n=1 Tax=Capronia epimyces CBS 606.96 TaxID=1182542 RepID=W9YGP1_9EURO|nr:uncharacterized protein A1O3_00612 [Capronia epimyces CBS 606.96]EXJ92062.1 hypothetical protein A1O3_00612 [Capronia epimyces CBS 606.96]